MLSRLSFLLLISSLMCAQTADPGTDLRPFSKKTNHCGYKNSQGRTVIEPRFGRCSNFSEGVALVQERGKLWSMQTTLDIDKSPSTWGYIDSKGEYVLQFKPEDYLPGGNFSEGVAPIYATRTKKYGYIDHRGQMVIAAQFDHAGPFSEGLAAVCSGEYHKPGEGYWLSKKEAARMATHKCGFIDHSGELKIPYSWHAVGNFRDGKAAFRNGKESGYIDKTGRVITPGQ